MRITAKVDYAVRVCAELAAADPGEPVKGEALATAQDVPLNFLWSILGELRKAGIVRTQRGAHGGYHLAQPASEITVADVIRAVEGPMATVRGESPEQVEYRGSAESLRQVWIAVRASLRAVAEHVTLEQIAAGKLPAHVTALTDDPDAWLRR